MRVTRRLRTALNAGLVSFVATGLVLALFVTPLLAGHADFGHVHSDSVPTHVHPIDSFFSSTPASTQQALTVTPLVSTAVFYAGVFFSKARRTCPLGSRAPPIA